MKNIEILQKVAELVGFTFSSQYKFDEVELEGGVIISNQTEGEFMIGDVIAIKNEDGTFTIVGSGEHKLADGRLFITDEEGKLVEIRDVVSETDVVEVAAAEVEVEVPDSVVGVMTPEVIEQIVENLTPIVEELKMLTEEMKKLKKDYENFKASSAYTPLKEDKLIQNAFSTDHRYEVLKEWKQRMRK
jgi:hypothetical protein